MSHIDARPLAGPSGTRRGSLRNAFLKLLYAVLVFTWGGAWLWAFCIIIADLVWAQGAAPQAGSVVDFGPVIDAVLDVLAPTIAAGLASLGGLALTRLWRWLGLKIDDSRRAAIEQGLNRAIGYALERVGERARGGIVLDVKSTAIATAANYASEAVPDALKHFRIDRVRLERMIESRLDGLVLEPTQDQRVSQQVSSS